MTEIIHLHRTQSRKSHTLNNIVEHHHGMPEIAFWQGARDSIQGLHLALQEHRARDRQTEEEGLLPSIAGIVQLGVSPRFVADVWRKHKGEILDPFNKDLYMVVKKKPGSGRLQKISIAELHFV